jgi:hypothetical protein
MKRVRDTSIAALRELLPQLPAREVLVLNALKSCERKGEAPTAYELLRTLQVQHPAYDPNAVRPRLTSLYQKHLVEHGAKRACAVTGRRVLTWHVVTAKSVTRELSEALQESLW